MLCCHWHVRCTSTSVFDNVARCPLYLLHFYRLFNLSSHPSLDFSLTFFYENVQPSRKVEKTIQLTPIYYLLNATYKHSAPYIVHCISLSIDFIFWCLSALSSRIYFKWKRQTTKPNIQYDLIFENIYGCMHLHASKKQWKEISQNVTTNDFGILFSSLPRICIFFSLFK